MYATNGDASQASSRAVELIHALNDPRFSSSVNAISQELLDLQLSPQGWTVADHLLGSADPNLQFYGALSFQVKLNRDSGSQHDLQTVLDRLVAAYCACTNTSGPQRVLDKICSALATYFVQTTTPWNNAVGRIVEHLLGLSGHPEAEYNNGEELEPLKLLHRLSARQTYALLRLCKFLAEDLGKFEGKSLKQHNVEQAFKTCVPVFCALMHMAVSQTQETSREVFDEALSAYSAWAMYAVAHWQHELETWTALQGLTDTITELMSHTDAMLALTVAETIAEVLVEEPKFFRKEQLSRMWPLIRQVEQSTQHMDTEDRFPLMKLIAAWAKSMIPQMMKHLDTQMFKEATMYLTQTLFDIDWAEDGCDRLNILDEFWMDFVDNFVDYNDELDDGIRAQFNAMIDSVVEAYFDALTRRDDQRPADIDTDHVEAWKRCCQDFAELMARLMESGNAVYDSCASQLERGLETHSWARIETTLLILNNLANDYDGMPASEQGLARIFSSSLFSQITQAGVLDQIPSQLKRFLVRFIDNYSSYFQQAPAQIPQIVTLLMNILEQKSSESSKLADLAAKCLASVCSSCRKTLVAMSDELLSFCDKALTTTKLTSYQREKIYSGMACVVQAFPLEPDKVRPVEILVSKLQSELSTARDLLSSNQQEESELLAVTAYQCLAGVGKALHTPQQHTVLLDDESPSSSLPWPDTSIPSQIVACLSLSGSLPSTGEIMDAVCAILRVGLSPPPGPFTVPPDLVASFLSSMQPTTPRLEALLTTTCAFLSSSKRPAEQVSPLLAATTNILLSIGAPETDPALAQLCTDVLERVLTAHPQLLLASPGFDGVVRFHLAALSGEAPMLKRAAAGFLSALLPLVGPALLPPLAEALAGQLVGGAQRSELDAVAKVVRSIVQVGPQGKGTLETALAAAGQVGEAERRQFVARVVMLRGGKGTAEACREFWARARGTVGSY